MLEAARLRLRPILMTSFAFIMGVVPLVLATGPGAEMRHAMGIAVFAGMLGVTLFGLLLTPVFYVLIRRLTSPEPPHRPAGRPDAAPLASVAIRRYIVFKLIKHASLRRLVAGGRRRHSRGLRGRPQLPSAPRETHRQYARRNRPLYHRRQHRTILDAVRRRP